MARRNPFGTFRKTGFGLMGGGGGARLGTHATLNLTPMIDMLTILLVFLIKNYSVSPAYLTPTAGIDLAITKSETIAPDKPVLIVGKNGLMIDGKIIVSAVNGNIDPKAIQQGEITELRKALDAIAAKTKFIAQKNSTVEFTGTLILQADKDIPYDSLKPILRTAGTAGFNDIKFAGLSQE